jgi:hypothetical protein
MENKLEQPNKTPKHCKTKTSYYRKLYVAYLIDTGINTVPLLLESTGMPKRTLQATISSLNDIDIVFGISGGTKNRMYSIVDWGFIDKNCIKNSLQRIKQALKLAD